MPSIEEAWEDVVYSRDAARALALTVMEEASLHYHDEDGVGRSCAACGMLARLRVRIEALK